MPAPKAKGQVCDLYREQLSINADRYDKVGLTDDYFYNRFNADLVGPAAPAAPAITNVGAAGIVAYGYELVAIDLDGNASPLSAEGSTATGNATIDGTNYNNVAIPAAGGGIADYKVYRSSSAGSPSTLGLLGHALPGSTTFSDKGLAPVADPFPPGSSRTASFDSWYAARTQGQSA